MAVCQQTTIKQNQEWFDHNDGYMESQSRLECYQNVRLMVEHELRGVRTLLDVGNGGFFNYDTALVDEVTAVDLFLEDGPGPSSNCAFRKGSLLDLPFANESFDCIMQQNVFHHVTGRTVRENYTNLKQCLNEMYRCLVPGGKAVVLESTVPAWFNLVECVLFRPALLLKRGGHPVTFQFTAKQIIACARECGFRLAEYSNVPMGNFILQFGHVWPTALTPVQTVKLILLRDR